MKTLTAASPAERPPRPLRGPADPRHHGEPLVTYPPAEGDPLARWIGEAGEPARAERARGAR